jgi:hypothetical protein
MTSPSYRLFLDLDGVLANFDQGVYQLTGCYPHQLTISKLWQVAARSNGFFEHLPWMPEGKKLWEATKKYNPTILTGLPRGQWAAPQKKAWCARELGQEVPVITCMAQDKIKWACEVLQPGEIPVIVDDRPKHKKVWETKGGIFIVHQTVSESLHHLNRLGFELD